MSKKEKMIRERIQLHGITSTAECFVRYKSFPSFTRNVISKMIDEGYNISIVSDAIDFTYYWIDCEKNHIFPQKRALN